MIKGKWHDKGSAAQTGAVLHFENDKFTINIDDGETLYGELSELKISDRLGNVERKLTLLNGSVFVTQDNDGVDILTKRNASFNSILHKLESNMVWVVVALFVTVATTGAFFKWGLPWASTQLAHALPHKTNEIIAGHTLDFLDEYFFEEESNVDPVRAEQIRQRFFTKLVPLENNATKINYQLHFRKWEFDDEGIPNALALPSGDIILTDKFVELSQNQNEIDAVLLHEMGHVVHRHSLQMLIQGTLITTIVMVATGDSNGLADFGLGLGSVLIASSYSRGHETEADIYAFEKMLKAKIDPKSFSTIMARMNEYMENLNGSDQDQTQKPTKPEKNNRSEEVLIKTEQNETEIVNKNDSSILDYLSSHPNTADRIKIADHYSDCFHKGWEICPPIIK